MLDDQKVSLSHYWDSAYTFYRESKKLSQSAVQQIRDTLYVEERLDIINCQR